MSASAAVLQRRAQQSLVELATPNRPPWQSFISGRYPFTYAYDHLRVRHLADSRAEASQALTKLAKSAGVDRDFAATLLARAYCHENNIALPPVGR